MKKIFALTLIAAFVMSASLSGEDIKVSGFNFEAGTFTTTLESKAAGKLNELSAKTNQVVMGHSQGGLTALGYIKKEKALAASQGHASNVKAFVSAPKRASNSGNTKHLYLWIVTQSFITAKYIVSWPTHFAYSMRKLAVCCIQTKRGAVLDIECKALSCNKMIRYIIQSRTP